MLTGSRAATGWCTGLTLTPAERWWSHARRMLQHGWLRPLLDPQLLERTP